MKSVAALGLILALSATALVAVPIRLVGSSGSTVPFAVGTHPGGVARGQRLAALQPAKGHSLIGFSSGCFWGTEQAFRKVPGIVATAVGYTGGTSQFPSYELAHRTGHLETVLVEFDPTCTPLSELLQTFWSLRKSTSGAPATATSPYQAAVWTYDPVEPEAAKRSLAEVEKKLCRKLRIEIRPAQPFNLAEEYHQQYDEKAGLEICNVSR